MEMKWCWLLMRENRFGDFLFSYGWKGMFQSRLFFLSRLLDLGFFVDNLSSICHLYLVLFS